VKKRDSGLTAEHTILLEEFLQHRIACRFRNINGMRKDVKKLLLYLEEEGLSPGEVGVQEAQAYQGRLLERGREDGSLYAPGSIQNFIKGALAFYDYLKKTGVVQTNPFTEIKRQRAGVKLPRHILKEKEMAKLLKFLGEYDREGDIQQQRTRYRLHVLAEVMYSTALRISEAAAIREEDIDFDRGVIEVKDIKSGHLRTVFLNEYARQVLEIYVKQTREEVMDDSQNRDFLFGAGGRSLILLFNSELKRAAKELGLPEVTSHSFRHAVGYHFLRSGCDIRYIQEVLGHKRIRNTEIYTKVDKESLRQVIDDFHPRKWGKAKGNEQIGH
jgi:site-specific recombinase XerD